MRKQFNSFVCVEAKMCNQIAKRGLDSCVIGAALACICGCAVNPKGEPIAQLG